MTGINFTNKLNQALRAQQAGIAVFFSALNIVLSITAALGNALILIALHKVSSIYPPSKLFFRCLAVTDLCVGLVVQPLFATSMLAPFTNMDENTLNYVIEANRVSTFILCGVSLFTSTAISVDRLLALSLGMRYRKSVPLRRVRVVIFSIWLIAGSNTAISRLWGRKIGGIFLIPINITLSVATSIFCYTRIYLRLRNQVQLLNKIPQGQPIEGRIPLNIAKYKKMVITVLWVQLALVACYALISITTALSRIGIESHVAFLTSNSILYLNSSLNPILYCWKIKEVKKEVKDVLRQLYCL